MQKRIFYILMIIFSGWSVQSQDLHYSQFYNSPLNINPALTGIFNGDKRITASWRDQWRSVPVPWLTFSGSYDQKLATGSNKNFIGLGLLFNYDRQGDSRIALTNFNISGSYNMVVSRKNVFSLGLMLGYASRGFNQNSLTWDKQWNGDSFDPALPNGENLAADMISMLETGAGLNYRWQEHDREHFDIGIGVYHILQPNTSFSNNGFDVNLPMRFSVSGKGTFQIGDVFDLDLNALFQSQTSYQEFLFGAGVNMYVNRKRGKETNLHVGIGYRTTQSIFPKIAIEFKNYYVGFSYDSDLSRFTKATDHKGGPELHFKYIIKSVKPLGLFKTCPIF